MVEGPERKAPIRSCFTCIHLPLCYLHHNIDEAVNKGLKLLNIDGNATPGKYLDIYSAIGNACMEYKLHPEA